MSKAVDFFGFEFLNFFLLLVLLLLVLRLLKGACVVTLLPTNSARIGGIRTKHGITYPRAGFKAFSFSFFFSLSHAKTQDEATEDS